MHVCFPNCGQSARKALEECLSLLLPVLPFGRRRSLGQAAPDGKEQARELGELSKPPLLERSFPSLRASESSCEYLRSCRNLNVYPLIHKWLTVYELGVSVTLYI